MAGSSSWIRAGGSSSRALISWVWSTLGRRLDPSTTARVAVGSRSTRPVRAAQAKYRRRVEALRAIDRRAYPRSASSAMYRRTRARSTAAGSCTSLPSQKGVNPRRSDRDASIVRSATDVSDARKSASSQAIGPPYWRREAPGPDAGSRGHPLEPRSVGLDPPLGSEPLEGQGESRDRQAGAEGELVERRRLP